MGKGKSVKRKKKAGTRTIARRPNSSSREHEHLKRLIENSADWYWEQDEQFRFTSITGRALEKSGIDPKRFLGKTHWELDAAPVGDGGWDSHKATLEKHLPFSGFLYLYNAANGARRYIDASGEPLFDAAGRFKGYHGIARDVTESKRIERATQRVNRMFRALNATNEAILRAKSLDELYQDVCESVMHGGNFLSVTLFVIEPGTLWANIAATSGPGEHIIRDVGVSVDEARPEGRGLVGTAFRTREACITNDFLNDERLRPWRELAIHQGYVTGAAFPLLVNNRCAGVIALYSGEHGEFDEEMVDLLRRMAQNVSHTIYAFEREVERVRVGRSTARLAKMYSALNSTGEAILRAKSVDELCQGVCDAAVHGSKFTATSIFVSEPGSLLAKMAGGAGPGTQALRGIAISMDESQLGGRGLIGTAFRTQQPTVTNDFLNDPRLQPWRETAQRNGFAAAAALPLLHGDQSIGVLIFYSSQKGEFDDDMLALVGRLAKNVAFALEKFRQDQERKENERALRESEARFRSLTELSSDWYWEQDSEFRFTRLEGSYVAGGESVDGQASIGKCRWETGLEVEGGWDQHRALLRGHLPFRDIVMYRVLPDGEKRYIGVSGQPTFSGDGTFIGYRGVGKDITARKRSEDRIQYLATHDGLTALPNRSMFSHLLNLAIQTAQRYKRSFAVMFIDLDRFKIINDSLGHEAGDRLLVEIASRLKQCLRASDVVARLGGDEFVVLVQEVTEVEQVAAVARKILSAVIKPMMLSGQECRVTGSVGISMYPADAQDEETLMKNADLAMYHAKEEGKNNYQFYSTEIRAQSRERLALEAGLRHALERNQLSLQYQAKVDMKSGAITGVEALLRWEHPDLGMVSPAHFIPIAEETGMIIAIGRWVLKTACKQNVAWQRAGLTPVCMSVNLSMRQFDDENLLADITEALTESGMAPQLLELEVTEGMVMRNVNRTTKLLAAIKGFGVRIAIDDFGTGYSSLAHIKRFPIDTLKVDRSFIREVPGDPEDRAITEAIIAMGKTLSLTVVAEGVETQEQETFLREHACDEMQGYYFSKPVVPEEFADLLRRNAAKQTTEPPAG